MPKYIIYMEDDDATLRWNVGRLQKEFPEYEFLKCRSTDRAQKEFEEHMEEVVCIVTDINMTEEFLDEQYVDETDGGMFTGWVWLYRYVLEQNPKLHIPIVICSGFNEYLRRYNLYRDNCGKYRIRIIDRGHTEGKGTKGIIVAIKDYIREGLM